MPAAGSAVISQQDKELILRSKIFDVKKDNAPQAESFKERRPVEFYSEQLLLLMIRDISSRDMPPADANGASMETTPDGTTVVRFADGTGTIRTQNGAIAERREDGTCTVRTTDGNVIIQHPDGSLERRRILRGG